MTISLMLAGMPNSGKTTFIAALRYCLQNADMKETVLSLEGLSADEKHLNMLQERWINCELVDRTKVPSEAWVEFSIRDTLANKSAMLLVPDLRGELFEQPASIGGCEENLLGSLVKCDGLLLFTNADREQDDVLISDVNAVVGTDDNADKFVQTKDLKDFRSDKIPEESKIVELLQAINRRPCIEKIRHIAVIISGWDAVDQSTYPEKWLEDNRPMLFQFLNNNSEIWKIGIYGVSAQGGQLPSDRDRLLAIELPTDRIIIKGNAARPHDLTAPIHWLLSNSERKSAQ